MGADVPISILLEKLKALKEERFIFPGLRNGVRIAVEELEKTLSDLNAEEDSRSSSSRLQEAPLLPTVNSPDVTSLLRSVYSAEYTIETFLLKTEIKPPLMALPIRPWAEIQFSSKLKKIVNGFKDVRSELRPHKHDPENEYTTNKFDDDTRRDDDEPDDDELVGREDGEEKKLVDRLIDDKKSLRVISLVSEEALGKTALARKVYNRLDIRQHFKRRAWLHVPQNFDKKDLKDLFIVILREITIGVWKDVELMSEYEMSALLFKSLMELRFLIVLDDVCTYDVWLMFVRPFADALNGSRVILTTRDSNLASNVDPWSHPLNLVPLTKEDAWALFKKKFAVGRLRPKPENKTNYNNSVQLDNFREHILEICGGLPPAILLLGGLLSTIELNEWSNVIDHVSDYLREGQSSLLNIVALLSYHKLRSELKLCFLYLALFPKANEISARRLLQLWIAEGFVKMSSTQGSEQPEDVARKYLEELKCRNMIEIVTRKKDGRPKTCRMLSFLHDFFMPKAKDIGFIHAHRCKSDCTEHQCSSDVCFKAQERGTFNREIDTLLKTIINRRRSRGCVLMKVLDLEGAYRPLLPGKLAKYLNNLRYVSLRWTCLDSCPESIGDLPCLETLDLKYTNITTMSSSIWKAKKLRHLYMNEVFIPKPPTSKEFLTSNLQTLSGLRIGSEDPDEYGLNQLTSLRKLGLTCHLRSTVEKTANCTLELNNLQTLKLRSRDHQFDQPSELVLPNGLMSRPSLSNVYLLGVIKHSQYNLPRNLDNLPQNLKILTLSMSSLTEDPIPVLGKLPRLNILRLFACSYLGTEMKCYSGDFPVLRVLKLWMLENLEKWTVKEGAMSQLVELEIRGCKELKSSDGLEQLAALKELNLTNMPGDFVAYVKQRLEQLGRSHILLTNDWKSSTLARLELMEAGGWDKLQS